MTLRFARWLPLALAILGDLVDIGYAVSDNDVARTIAAAVEVA